MNKDVPVGFRKGSVTYLGHDDSTHGINKQFYLKCDELAKDHELYGDAIFLVDRKVAKKMVLEKGRRGFQKWQFEIVINRLCGEKDYIFNGFVGGVDNITSGTKLKLHCNICGYDWGTTSVSKFLDCGRGCPSCSNNISKLTTRQFVEDAISKHGAVYDYSLININDEIILSRQKLDVNCLLHGPWPVDYQHHVERGSGCPHPECCWKKISEVKASNTEEFIHKAIKVHGDKYDYTDTVYHRAFTTLEIKCNACKNVFPQLASDHLSGCGCPYCAGKNQKELYIFKVSDGDIPVAIKSGIAINHKIRLRQQQGKSCYDLEVITVFVFDEVEDCKKAESECKATLNRGILTKQEYPDGYMETYNINDLDKIKEIAVKYNGVENELYM